MTEQPGAERPALGRASPLRYLPGVGPRRAEQLAASGLFSVEDLLFHLPLRYEDRRHVVPPEEVTSPGVWTVAGRIEELRLIRTRRRGFVIVRARVESAGGALPIRWFNQPYLLQRFAAGDEVLLHGNVVAASVASFEMVNPSISALAGHSAGAVVPIYPRLAGFGPAGVARLMAGAAAVLDDDPPPDLLPTELCRRYGFSPLASTLRMLHAPPSDADLAALERRDTLSHCGLAYRELLELFLELAELRRSEVGQPKPHAYRIDDRVRAVARKMLPFALTAAQKRVLREIAGDLVSPQPMLRLLQGDVGSGKTIVAAIALLLAAESGLQGVFMAPTELLAQQQFERLGRLLGKRHHLALVTSSTIDAATRRRLESGEIALAVGTQALIQERICFARLALAVVDEQHRFGVEQRRLLQEKGAKPDVLVMTATPIPRSLALTVYGDLDLSVIDELPPGRRPVTTEVLPAAARGEVYRRLRAELTTGAQAFVVFPLIEESEEITAASLAQLGGRVRAALRDFPSAVLHGRLAVDERERIARRFAQGELRVLVTTTVVEVGIDVASASWMVIESAERFGLAQLHQLRGRVGRGERPSCCVAIHGRLSAAARRRLEIFATTTDGFAIAEADLELRGPGDLLGKRQAGLPSFRLADLVRHRDWIERARADAREIAARGDEPAFAPLVARARARVPERYRALAGG